MGEANRLLDVRGHGLPAVLTFHLSSPTGGTDIDRPLGLNVQMTVDLEQLSSQEQTSETFEGGLLAPIEVERRSVMVWLNGTHGVGKTTTSVLVQELLPNARIFDAEKVGETLMDVRPGLPATDDFQHWPPWRSLVVETVHRILECTGGTLVMPMTVLVEQYWREIADGLAAHGIAVRHFLLHADRETLRERIANDTVMGPSAFRYQYVSPYGAAFQGWLQREAEVVDTRLLTPTEVAHRIVKAVTG